MRKIHVILLAVLPQGFCAEVSGLESHLGNIAPWNMGAL